MTNIIIIAILLLIVSAAVAYIVKAKKNGARCIGCPAGGNCPGKNGGKASCTCGCQNDTKEK